MSKAYELFLDMKKKENMNTKKSNKIRWFAWSLVTFFYAYQYILRVMPSILMDDIVKKFGISPNAFGQFSGVYYLGYSLMHLPVGIFLDRFGPKRVLPLLIASTSLGLLPILYTDAFIYPVLGRALIGIGSSGAILGVFKVLHLYFDHRTFSRFLSFSVTIGVLGGIYGGAPIHFAREHFGFENVVLALIVVSLILALISYLGMPHEEPLARDSTMLQSLINVFANKRLLLVCFIAGFMVGPMEGFADVWGVQFLKIFHGLSDSVASGLPSFIYIGMCCGGPIISFLMERTGKIFHLVLVCAVVMGASFALMSMVQLSAFTLSLLMFVVGLCSSYQILMITQVSDYVAEADRSLSSVAANMIIMIFGYVFHSLIGKSIHWFSLLEGVDGFRDPHVLRLGISCIPAFLLLSGLLLFWIIRQKSFNTSSTS